MTDEPDFYTKSGQPSKIKHGTETAYINMNCRCDKCKAARAKRKQERSGRPPKAEPEHGKSSTYTYRKCRCDACTLAQKEYRKWLRDQHKG